MQIYIVNPGPVCIVSQLILQKKWITRIYEFNIFSGIAFRVVTIVSTIIIYDKMIGNVFWMAKIWNRTVF